MQQQTYYLKQQKYQVKLFEHFSYGNRNSIWGCTDDFLSNVAEAV